MLWGCPEGLGQPDRAFPAEGWVAAGSRCQAGQGDSKARSGGDMEQWGHGALGTRGIGDTEHWGHAEDRARARCHTEQEGLEHLPGPGQRAGSAGGPGRSGI